MSCEWNGSDLNAVDYRIRGTWESTNPDEYSGTLVLTSDSITITGYSKEQTPWLTGDDNQRPFKDFPKGIPLTCYTEDKKLFIKVVGEELSISYEYSSKGLDKFLLFTFAGRPEGLKLTGIAQASSF